MTIFAAVITDTAMLKIRCFNFNPFQECCTVASDDSGKAVIVDPGCYDDKETAALASYISGQGLSVEKILLTHGHFDHIFGVSALAALYDVPVLMSPADTVILENNAEFCNKFGLKVPDTDFAAPADKGGHLTPISDGNVIEWGQGNRWEVLATPGHTPGGVCFLDRSARLLISGDTLFAGSIGRTDNRWGDYDALMKSIFTKLMPLDGDIEVIPGHGPHTSITDERTKNPFLLPFNEPLEEEDHD